MTGLEKPPKRGLKQPKRIARNTRPIARKARPKKQRKTTRAGLGRQADKLWSQIVRLPGKCEACGKTAGVVHQAAHGFSRRYRGTRWLLINGFDLDSGCHVRFTHDPIGWDDWLYKAWGAEAYHELRRLARKTSKDLDMEAIVAGMRDELARRSSLLTIPDTEEQNKA